MKTISANALVINVASIVGRAGSGRDLAGMANVKGFETAMVRLGGNGLRLKLRLDSVTEGVAVTGDVSGEWELTCSRCLEEYKAEFSHQVDEVFKVRATGDGYEIHESQIELEPVLRDVVLADAPTHPLHSLTCKGLCPVCGINLNEGDCGHDRRPVRSVWAPLEELKDRLSNSSEGAQK